MRFICPRSPTPVCSAGGGSHRSPDDVCHLAQLQHVRHAAGEGARTVEREPPGPHGLRDRLTSQPDAVERGDLRADRHVEVHMIVRAALDLAVERELVVRNVAHGARARRRPPTRAAARVWNAAELRTFLHAARSQRLYPALHLAACTGMRRGEVAGLKWSDLDTSGERLSISRTLQNVGGTPVEFGVKTRASRRTVELDRATVNELRRWRQRLHRDGLPHGRDDWMFCNASGRFPNPESIGQLFDRVVRRSGLPRIRFHDLRHTHASLLIADGAPIKVVSERLGHAHPAYTMHTYQHLWPGMSARAAEQFASLIGTSHR